MAVFTPVAPEEALALLQRYDSNAALLELHEISAGIENTNYFVSACLHGDRMELVLTLFEALPSERIAHFISVMNWWVDAGFPVPAPCRDLHSIQLQQLNAKPAILSPRLPGRHPLAPSVEDCRTIGQLLGRMQQHAVQAPFQQPVERTLLWMRRQQQQLEGVLPRLTARRLALEIDHYEQCLGLFARCPQGLVHGDLFRDNVLFEQNTVSGLIDFYHSGRDVLLFDLAVVANDWCKTTRQRLDQDKLQALLQGYRSQRRWSPEETQAWPHILRLAALRFWLARLISRYLPGYQRLSLTGDKTKDPEEFELLLDNLRKTAVD